MAAPVRISWCTPCDGRAGDRAGHPEQRAVEPAAQLAVLRAPLRTAASTTTVPRVRAGDHPVARQEPQPGGRAARGSLGDHGALGREVVEQARGGPPGRPGRHRRPAPRRSGRRPRTRRGARPGRSRTRRPRRRRSRRAPTPAAMLGGDVGAVGRGGPGADHRDRRGPSWSSRSGPRTHRPERQAAALLEGRGRAPGRRPGWATRRRPGSRSGCPSRSAWSRSRSGSSGGQPEASVGGRPSSRARPEPGAWTAGRTELLRPARRAAGRPAR